VTVTDRPSTGEQDIDSATGADEGNERDESSTGQVARVVLVAVIAALLGLWALDIYAVPAAARARQQHRVDEYQDPSARVKVGDAALLMQVPALQLNQVVVKGASPELLRGGPGWRQGSAAPGAGNTVVMGRSTRWSHPFARLADVPKKSVIYLRTRDARVYRYSVVSVRTVDGGRTSVMDPAGPSRLTLVTSAAGPFDSHRTVVVAKAVGSQPKVPKSFREPERTLNQLGPFDERGAGGLLLLLSGFLVAALGVVGVLELRQRYSMLTVVVVAGPALVLGVVLVLFNLDAFLPITY